MRVLLDNCVPLRFGKLVVGHEIKHVGRSGRGNLLDGELLHVIATEADVFLTVDKSIRFQQNLKSIAFAIIVLRAKSNRLRDLAPLAPARLAAMTSLRAGDVLEVWPEPA